MQLEITSCLGYGPQSLNFDAQAKINIFYQLALLCNNLVFNVILSGIYLESWFSWLGGRLQKTSRKGLKQTEEKHWWIKAKKNSKYKESQITTTGIFCFTFFIKNYIFLKNIVVVKGKKVKSSLYHHISFAVFMRCRIFKTQ